MIFLGDENIPWKKTMENSNTTTWTLKILWEHMGQHSEYQHSEKHKSGHAIKPLPSLETMDYSL